MKIAILDDYRNVASNLADWDSLAAEVVVFTRAPGLPSGCWGRGRPQTVDRSKANKRTSNARPPWPGRSIDSWTGWSR
jgi:hypothetical protein